MTYKYQYKDPRQEGFVKVKLSKEAHNKLFPNYPRSFMLEYEYYLKSDAFLVQRFDSAFAIFLCWVTLPFALLCFGLANYKKIIKEHVDLLNQKESGKFVEIGRIRDKAKLEEIIKEIKI